ncbi:MAG: DUF4129 domain-containing protein [Spirosomataceae bacterium]
MKQFVFFLFFILLGSALYAQGDEPKKDSVDVATAAEDNASVKLRTPSTKQLEEFRNNRDYNYKRASAPQNPLAKFWYWLMDKLNAFFQSGSYQHFWQYVILALLGGLAIWLLYKANFSGGLFGRQATEDALTYHRVTENIHELDFNTSIEDALQQRNYRLAVRLYYLKSLKQLTDRQLIYWQPTKTNRVYVHELEHTPFKMDFEQLTSQFEYIWYGEFAITEEYFGLVKEQFQAFSTAINKITT